MKKEKRDILFLCQFFYPEHVSSATLPFDTAAALHDAGFSVDALVGYPKEYTRGKDIPKKETVRGVGIRRLRYLQSGRGSTIGRLMNYFSFTASVLLHLRILKRHRAVIVYSNPPILPAAAILAKKLWKTKFVFIAYDVYPEIAYASRSILPGSLIDRGMKRINRSLYKNADCVVALTNEMRSYLLEKRKALTPERVEVIPNWAHEGTVPADPRTRTEFGFSPDCFIAAYFGNMGICQDMRTILDAAIALKRDERIGFLLIGHGKKLELLRSEALEHGLQRFRIYDFLEAESFAKAVACADCYLVTLEPGLKGTCAPSKYYSYLQGARPVIAVAENGSCLAEEIGKEEIGAFVENGDVEGLTEILRRMAEAPEDCARMGKNAKRLYDRAYQASIGLGSYQALLHRILKK